MATEKQIAANRANALQSTGPRTLAGRLKSSRNAYRHGLSGPARLDPKTLARADALARALAGGEGSEDKLTSAREFAQVQLELVLIRPITTDMMAKLETSYNNT